VSVFERLRETERRAGEAERRADESEARLMLVMDWLKAERGRHDAKGRGGQTAGGPYPPRVLPSALIELERLVSDDQGRYTADAVRALAERAETAEARLREVERERDEARAELESDEYAENCATAMHQFKRERDAAKAEAAALRAEVERLRRGLTDAIELAEEGWSYVDDCFRTKWRYLERMAALRGKGDQ
jgi:hypothetical protein